MIDDEMISAEREEAAPEPQSQEDLTVTANAPESELHEDTAKGEAVDYAELAAADLAELKEQFPELSAFEDITEIENPLRYAALRDLGLTPREAYLATNERRRRADNRSHLSAAVPRGAGVPRGGMSRDELYRAREIFDGMSDTEIQALYRRVNA